MPPRRHYLCGHRNLMGVSLRLQFGQREEQTHSTIGHANYNLDCVLKAKNEGGNFIAALSMNDDRAYIINVRPCETLRRGKATCLMLDLYGYNHATCLVLYNLSPLRKFFASMKLLTALRSPLYER